MTKIKYHSRNIESLRVERRELEKKFSTRQRRMLEEIKNYKIIPTVQFLREEFGTDYFANITLDAQHNRLTRAYMEVPTGWRAMSNIVAVTDFKAQNAVAMSGFDDLDIVPENGEYPLHRPEDESRGSYQIQKRGAILGLTLEAQANDSLGAFGRKVAGQGQAAARTLDKFCLTTNLSSNPTIYDSVALVHANHNNIQAGGLSAETLKSGIQLMKEQTGIKADEEIELRPNTLVVHPDDEFLARELLGSPLQIIQDSDQAGGATPVNSVRGNMNTLRGIIPNLLVTVRMASAGTDAGRAKWALLADPMTTDMFEVGFFQGRTEPELFMENPGAPSEFDSDVSRWKVRHIYNGAWRDFRGVVGGNF